MFEIYTDRAGEWRWRYRDQRSSKILFVSSQGYKQKRSALHCISRAQQSAPDPIEHLTVLAEQQPEILK